jgi:hypothetical protein
MLALIWARTGSGVFFQSLPSPNDTLLRSSTDASWRICAPRQPYVPLSLRQLQKPWSKRDMLPAKFCQSIPRRKPGNRQCVGDTYRHVGAGGRDLIEGGNALGVLVVLSVEGSSSLEDLLAAHSACVVSQWQRTCLITAVSGAMLASSSWCRV